MGVGQAIGTGFKTANSSWPLVGLLFAFNLVWNLGSIPFAQTQPDNWGAGTWAFAVLFIVTFLVLAVFVQGGMLGYAHAAVKEGKPQLPKFWESGKHWFKSLFLLGLVLVGAAAVVGLIFVVTFAMALGVSIAWENNTVAIVLANILAVAISGVGLYFLFLLFFAPYVLVSDGAKVMEAVRGSVKFMRSCMLRVVGLLAALIGISMVAMLVVGLVALLLITIKVPTGASDVLVRILSSGLNSYLGVVTATTLIGYYLGRKTDLSASSVRPAPAGPAPRTV